MSTSVPVSFTIRRPSPASRATSSGADSDNNSSFKIPSIPRHLANDSGSNTGSPLARSANASPKRTYESLDSSSDDDEDELNDQLVTGFDKFGVQRKHENKKKQQQQGPLVIPALKDRDWRELARKRKALHRYVPASAKSETGADGSVGGLGTRDSINSGPQLSGIQIKQKRVKVESEEDMAEVSEVVKVEVAEETEDAKAMRAILAAGTNGIVPDGPIVDIIPQQPITETDAYRQDVQDFPDEATLDDYARIPVSQFGAALLRGMGWKEGAPITANGRKLVQPWLPTARPALLGIGAKEEEVYDDGSGKGRKHVGKGRPEKRYVPLVKKERERDGEGSGSGRDSRRTSPPSRRESAPSSRRGSRSPSPRRRHHDRDDRKRDYGKDREWGKDRDSRRGDHRDYDRDRERHRDRDGDRRERKDKRD